MRESLESYSGGSFILRSIEEAFQLSISIVPIISTINSGQISSGDITTILLSKAWRSLASGSLITWGQITIELF